MRCTSRLTVEVNRPSAKPLTGSIVRPQYHAISLHAPTVLTPALNDDGVADVSHHRAIADHKLTRTAYQTSDQSLLVILPATSDPASLSAQKL
ncbi:MAG: hypothetical protein ACKVIK_14725 [Rhodospirillales bacterium]